MILAIDVGNTNIVLGFLDGEELVNECRLSTEVNDSAEEYAIKLNSIFEICKIEPSQIEGSVLSSVVPPLNRTISKAVKLLTGKKPIVIGPGVKTGLNIKTNNPAELGADMVAGAVAGIAKYPCPQIIFDLGTATTASVIDKNGCFIGCSIQCGVKTALNALSAGTAQLPQIEIVAPKSSIGTNTVDCMRSGTVYGTAAMIDGLVKRFEKELGSDATVIITGGLGGVIAQHCETDVIVDRNLVIDGLRMIYEKNI
ncbi:MAG: type III pantothenate kinase [Eubacteriales bacterium]|nr:type III pantothenate kinase [Eubacteriales bacterium]